MSDFMKNKEAKNMVDDIFKEIKKATSIEKTEKLICNRYPEIHEIIEKSKTSYPRIDFSLIPKEIQELTKYGFLDEEGNLFDDTSKYNCLCPLTRLLYSIVWKNGDLKKIKHIVQGIKAANIKELCEKKDGLVFYNFGKFLTKTGHPIIDQHVLRAFAVFKTKENDCEKIEKLRKKNTFNCPSLIECYKKWIQSLKLDNSNKNLYRIDKLLFALGKTIKKGKHTNSP